MMPYWSTIAEGCESNPKRRGLEPPRFAGGIRSSMTHLVVPSALTAQSISSSSMV